MKIIEPYVQIEDEIDGDKIILNLEKFGRTCYKSNEKIKDNESKKFISFLLKKGHESVLEHEKVSVRIICDRGISHQIVRHRIGSYSQESTRFCNYSSDKFNNEITFIKPCFWEEGTTVYDIWFKSIKNSENAYFDLINNGATPEQARSVLPNSLKTEIVVTYNLRQWRHFLKQRTAEISHPQMREIAIELLKIFKSKIPIIFDDILTKD